MMEATLLLATIASRFRVVVDAEREVTPFPSITLRPQGGVPVTVTRRSRA
jgi:cytochrome P450